MGVLQVNKSFGIMSSMIYKQRTTNNITEIVVLCMNNLKVSKYFLHMLYENTIGFDLVMIDNNSNDGTQDYLKEFADSHTNMTLVLNDENKGVIGGRNQGYEIINQLPTFPENILFLDNDQFVQKDWLPIHMSVLNRGYAVVGVEAWQINRGLYPSLKINSLNQWYSYVGCGGMIVKKKIIDEIGLFDSIYNPAYFEDPDFNFRIHEKGYQIGWNFVAEKYIKHLPHQTLGFQKNKNQIFLNSHNKFKEKWKNKHIPQIYQVDLPEFH